MDRDNEALAIIRGWNWEYWSNNRCEVVPIMRPLSEMVNDLAMSGNNNPAQTILSLLANGKLTASGSGRWRAHINSEYYEKDIDGTIPASRWKQLAVIITETDDALFTNSYVPQVNLVNLGIGQTDKYIWEWRNDFFSFACASKDDWRGNSEEWFSVQDIALLPPEADAMPLTVAPASLPVPAIEPRNKGGRPLTYDWEKAIAALIFQWADKGDWQPASKAEVQRALGNWFAEQGATPSDSLLKGRSSWLFQEFESRKLEG